MTIAENPQKIRFIKVRNALKLSQVELANAIDVDKSAISKIENEAETKRLPTLSILIKLQEKFNISKQFITEGKGDIFLNSPLPTTKSQHKQYDKPNKIMEELSRIINKDRDIDEQIDVTSVYNVHLTTGSVAGLINSSKVPDILLLNGAFQGCDLVIRHSDPAMTGFFDENSFIGVKKIPKEDYEKMIVPGKCYVIVMNHYILERYLYPGKKKPFLLKSAQSKTAPDFEIDYDQVVELYLIKGWTPAPRLNSL